MFPPHYQTQIFRVVVRPTVLDHSVLETRRYEWMQSGCLIILSHARYEPRPNCGRQLCQSKLPRIESHWLA